MAVAVRWQVPLRTFAEASSDIDGASSFSQWRPQRRRSKRRKDVTGSEGDASRRASSLPASLSTSASPSSSSICGSRVDCIQRTSSAVLDGGSRGGTRVVGSASSIIAAAAAAAIASGLSRPARGNRTMMKAGGGAVGREAASRPTAMSATSATNAMMSSSLSATVTQGGTAVPSVALSPAQRHSPASNGALPPFVPSSEGVAAERRAGKLAEGPLVGVFDSGIGGLSVVMALQELQPNIRVSYVADTAFFPYGDRSEEEIRSRVLSIGRHLEAEGCSMIVVACNTASSIALEDLRATVAVPVVGMEPPLKPAVAISHSRHVVVLATTKTAEGARLRSLRESVEETAKVWITPMPGLADIVEDGELAGPRLEKMLRTALDEPLACGADVVALGCTHYGFVRDALLRIVPPHVRVIDAAAPVARHILTLLDSPPPQMPPPSGPNTSSTSNLTSITTVATSTSHASPAAHMPYMNGHSHGHANGQRHSKFPISSSLPEPPYRQPSLLDSLGHSSRASRVAPIHAAAEETGIAGRRRGEPMEGAAEQRNGLEDGNIGEAEAAVVGGVVVRSTGDVCKVETSLGKMLVAGAALPERMSFKHLGTLN